MNGHLLASCPSCHSKRCRFVGAIPASDVFAGRQLPAPIPGGALFACHDCELRFRHPRLAKHELDALYAAGSTAAWSAEAQSRTDWSLARTYLERTRPVGAVLDLGCFCGAFLGSLPDRYHKYGIEIHPRAAAVARAHGIDVIGSDFSQAGALDARFDVVTAFDVIEHAEDPALFLAKAAMALKHDGILLISTGDPDFWGWRHARGRYWYCTIPEHISFVSPSWFERCAAKIGLRVSQVTRFARRNCAPLATCMEAGMNLLNIYAPAAGRMARRLGLGGKDVRRHPQLVDFPPAWMTARDHVLVVLTPGSCA